MNTINPNDSLQSKGDANAVFMPVVQQPWLALFKSAMELPPDSRWDEIALQIIGCKGCSFTGLALYEESRRGPMDSEYVNHTGYYISKNNLERIGIAISQCPDPKDRNCSCYSHRKFGEQDDSARWMGLDDIRLDKPFTMELYRGKGKPAPPDSDLPDFPL